jgi:MFS family permease
MTATSATSTERRFAHIPYKWIALSNTTLGVLMAAINGTILIISLPAIFRGIHVNPLVPGQTGLLLWVLMGFNVATTVFLVTFGRISDTYGRVRLYNLGFLVFTLGSVLLFLTWGTGIAGEWQLIIFRFIQGIGGAFLFANSAAILTDAFPANQRGLALGLNQVAAIGGSVIGLVVGGLLSAWDWRMVFLVNVPVGLAGTVWAYLALHEVGRPPRRQRVDIWGNITFGLGMLGILVGLTYGIIPWKTHTMGWQNPFVLVSLIGGVVLLAVSIWVESVVTDPMFPLGLFRSRAFAAGNLAGLLGSVARGGLQFMIIIWLQGIWLPLHGVSYTNTPLQAGIDTLPQMVGFLIAGPLSGRLSDRYGARWFGFAGMVASALGFFLLQTLPYDFHYWSFATYLFLIGLGMGMFASPNTTAIMNSVPARHRGVASGMRATFQNAGMMVSMGIFFTIIIVRLANLLPGQMTKGLLAFGLPMPIVQGVAHLPPTATLFAALLGYNPMAHLIPPAVLAHLPPLTVHQLIGERFFPTLIAPAFSKALSTVFLFSMTLSLVSAVASLLRGRRYIYEEEEEAGEGRAPNRQLLKLALVAVWMAREGAEPGASAVARERLRRALMLLSLLVKERGDDRALPKPTGTEPVPAAPAE